MGRVSEFQDFLALSCPPSHSRHLTRTAGRLCLLPGSATRDLRLLLQVLTRPSRVRHRDTAYPRIRGSRTHDRDQETLSPLPPSPLPGRRQLPDPLASFRGRAKDLARLHGSSTKRPWEAAGSRGPSKRRRGPRRRCHEQSTMHSSEAVCSWRAPTTRSSHSVVPTGCRWCIQAHSVQAHLALVLGPSFPCHSFRCHRSNRILSRAFGGHHLRRSKADSPCHHTPATPLGATDHSAPRLAARA